uniref:Ovule protein n=1 Tax=Caenorhabditis tropicalis TaxID=1561998 RepID=A0A1I7UCK2_9PELO
MFGDLESILSKGRKKMKLKQLDTNQKSNEYPGQQKNDPKSKDQNGKQDEMFLKNVYKDKMTESCVQRG